jgi:hypothetical protein
MAVVLPLVIACGANDNSGLFSQASGGHSTSSGGSLSTGGGSSTRGGSSSGGTVSSNGGASAAGNLGGSGQGESGSNTGVGGAAGNAAGGMNGGGMSAGGEHGGTGGTNAGGASAGTGNAGTGDPSAGTGGMSAGGTGGGSSGSGGSGGADACPVNAPGNGMACMVPTPSGCFYPGFACTCIPQNGGGPGGPGGPGTRLRWACFGSRVPPCVQDLPVTGDPCNGHGGAQCPYSSTEFCACTLAQNQNQNPSWECSAGNGFTCPNNAPNDGELCKAVAICQYPGGACACNGARWVCQGG